MNVAILLSTAFITTMDRTINAEKRIEQYIIGLNQIIDEYGKKNLDIYLADNTIENKNSLDARLLKCISCLDAKNIIFFDENQYGGVNKGCGVIAQWKKILPTIMQKNKYLIHFEPRQRLVNFGFIDQCLESKKNIFRKDVALVKKFKIFNSEYIHFQTGLFGVEAEKLFEFTESVNTKKMYKNKKSIEKLIYNFLIHNEYEYDSVSKLGLLWDNGAGYVEI